MGKRKRLPSEERRRSLIHAAIEVFSESNYRVAKIADISARDGISDPMIYTFFESKKELFLEILTKTSNKTLANYLTVNLEDYKKVKNKNELRNLIKDSLLLYFNSMEKYRKEIKIYYQAISEIDDVDIQKVIKAAYKKYADFYISILEIAKDRNIIKKDVNTEFLAWDIVGFTIHQSTLFIMDFYEEESLKIYLTQRLQAWI